MKRDPVLGERLLEDDLALGEDAGFLGALERVLRGLAELLDLLVVLVELRPSVAFWPSWSSSTWVSTDSIFLSVFDLRLRDLLVDVGRRRATDERRGRRRPRGE